MLCVTLRVKYKLQGSVTVKGTAAARVAGARRQCRVSATDAKDLWTGVIGQ